VPPAGGRFPIEVAAPWPFTAALLDLPARRRAVALEDLRSVRIHERKAHVRATLLTLAPTFPTRSGPCDPAANRVSSRGVVQRSPLHRSSRGIRFPEVPCRHGAVRRVSAPPGSSFEMGMPFPSACRPRGLSPPRRFVPPRPCSHFQAAADPGVHHVSSCRETGFPAVRLLPFEAFPPPTAAVAGSDPGPPRVRVTAPIVADRRVHRVPCPLAVDSP
jgi:hypothetical protein